MRGRLLEDPEWGRWSDREIARRVGVSHMFVTNLRNEFLTVNGLQSEPRTYITRHGTPAVMNTANTGKPNPPTSPTFAPLLPPTLNPNAWGWRFHLSSDYR